MEQTGKVVKIFAPRTGTSQKTGKDWVSQSFLLEVRTGEHGQYTRKMLFSIFGEDEIKNAQLYENKDVKVSFDIEAKENPKNPGMWFNDVKAWKVEPAGGQQTGYAPQQYPPQQRQYPPQPQAGYAPQGGGYPPNTGYYQQQPYPPQQPPAQGEPLPF